MSKKLERLYYPLQEAAEFLGCSVRDILHFNVIFKLKLCVFIDRHKYGGVVNGSGLQGYYFVRTSNIDKIQFDDNEKVIVYSVNTLDAFFDGDEAPESSIIYFNNKPYVTDRKFLHVMCDDLYNFEPLKIMPAKEESVRTMNRKGEIIPALLRMIPEFDDFDLENGSVSSISAILEATAASKGIELTLPEKSTMARYLGRK